MELVVLDKFTFKKLQTACSSLRPLFDVRPDNILDTPILDRFVKAFFNVKLPRRRQLTTWNVDQLLDYLETMRSPSQLAVYLLGAKLATLVLLATGCRLGELAVFHLDHLQFTPMGFNFQLPHFAKTYSPTTINSDLMRFYVRSTSMNPKLCPLLHLQEYIKRTEHLCTSRYLFISSVEPFGKLSQQRLSTWVHYLLVAAGVQGSGKFQSVHSVVSSALLTKGVPVDQILAKCHWKSAHAFYSNYHVRDPTLSARAFRAACVKLCTAMDNKVTPANKLPDLHVLHWLPATPPSEDSTSVPVPPLPNVPVPDIPSDELSEDSMPLIKCECLKPKRKMRSLFNVLCHKHTRKSHVSTSSPLSLPSAMDVPAEVPAAVGSCQTVKVTSDFTPTTLFIINTYPLSTTSTSCTTSPAISIKSILQPTVLAALLPGGSTSKIVIPAKPRDCSVRFSSSETDVQNVIPPTLVLQSADVQTITFSFRSLGAECTVDNDCVESDYTHCLNLLQPFVTSVHYLDADVADLAQSHVITIEHDLTNHNYFSTINSSQVALLPPNFTLPPLFCNFGFSACLL